MLAAPRPVTPYPHPRGVADICPGMETRACPTGVPLQRCTLPQTTLKGVALMQPYFFPYAGYFRLFAAVDTFIIYDCVQFPRRGRVHRVEVPGPDGNAHVADPAARLPSP